MGRWTILSNINNPESKPFWPSFFSSSDLSKDTTEQTNNNQMAALNVNIPTKLPLSPTEEMDLKTMQQKMNLEQTELPLTELTTWKRLIDIPELRIHDYKVFESWILYVEQQLRDLGLESYLQGNGQYKNLDCVIRQNIMSALPDETQAHCYRADTVPKLMNKLKNLKVNYMW
ncbi:hypothetical protein TRVA0_020S00848 [Trichomonascus vanleenenianus]|uniref:uncharacterized protein n=1 Tax=Trichomonascus vanleenenianus TaxID=2268995 RepID=UPI003ECAF841